MVPVMQQIFVYGKETIPYSVLFSARRTLGIKVYPSGEVVLLAPEGTPEEVIEQKLHKRAPWILRQQAYFKDFGIRSPETVCQRKSHYYLESSFLLRVSERQNQQRHRYKGRCFENGMHLSGQGPGVDEIWYREHAKLKFAEYAEPIIPDLLRSCANLTLCQDGKPLERILHPRENHSEYGTHPGAASCIEYVITHEMCHLLHPDHTAAFFTLLETGCPTGGVGKTSWSDS